MDAVLKLEERKQFLTQALDKWPYFDSPAWRENLEQVANHSMVTLQSVQGMQFATLFITHESLPVAAQKSIGLAGDSRFFKSVVFSASGAVISIGLPHFFSLQTFADTAAGMKDLRYYTKLDGTCVLITKLPEGFLLRSRRRIYAIAQDLSCLNLPNLPEVGRHLEDWFAGTLDGGIGATVSAEAIVPHPSLGKYKLPPFYERALQASGFCPYVAYSEPGLVVTNVILRGRDYIRLLNQTHLDAVGAKYGFPRPPEITFRGGLPEAEQWLKHQRESEGFCVYGAEDQQIFKYKTRWYKSVHGVVSTLHNLLAA